MADEQKQQQVSIRLDESKMNTTYANTIRTSTTADEMVLDFGLNLPVQQSSEAGVQMVFSVGSRVVLNWAGAKRLAMSLTQAINAYENHYGPIQIGSGTPQPGPTPPQNPA